jgi:hypothetical protein
MTSIFHKVSVPWLPALKDIALRFEWSNIKFWEVYYIHELRMQVWIAIMPKGHLGKVWAKCNEIYWVTTQHNPNHQ